jgi:hypothetical protein
MAATRQALRGLARCQYDSFLRSFRANVVSCEANPDLQLPTTSSSTTAQQSKKKSKVPAVATAPRHPCALASHVITLDDTM